MLEPLSIVQPLSIQIRQHSQHTICNEVLMKGEYGCLPASLSARQSAYVIGGRVGSAAAYSPLSLTHPLTNHPKNTAYATAVLPQTASHPPAPLGYNRIMQTPQKWSRSTGDLTQSFSLVEYKR